MRRANASAWPRLSRVVPPAPTRAEVRARAQHSGGTPPRRTRTGRLTAATLVLMAIAAPADTHAAAQQTRATPPSSPAQAPIPVARPAPQPTGGPPPVEIRAKVDRTAAWVGDRVTYEVELRCDPTVDVLTDDLAREAVKVDGGELVEVETQREDQNGRTVHRVRYTLVTYRIDVTEMAMQALPVRYAIRTAGVTPTETAPTGQVMVPPVRIAVRSVIPVTQGELAARTPTGLGRGPQWLRWAEPVGLVLILLGIVPVALGGLDLARRARSLVAAYRTRQSRRQHRSSFEDIRALDPSSDASRIEAFGQLDTYVKEHLRTTTGVDAHALTPIEIQRALDQRTLDKRTPDVPSEPVFAILDACERARYDTPPPTAADWSEALRRSEETLGTSGRWMR